MDSINDVLSTHFMLVTYQSSKPPQSKKLRKASREVAASAGADEKSVSAIKELWVDCPEMDKVNSAIGAAGRIHTKFTAPYNNSDYRLIRNEVLMNEYIPAMNEAVQAIEDAATELIQVYDYRVQQQLNKLGGFGDEKDYPSVDEINNWPWFSYTLAPVPAPGDWNRVQGVGEIADYLQEQTTEAANDAAKVAIQDACKKVIKPIEAMAYATDPNHGGKRARPIGANLVENIRHAASNIRQFNIFNDPKVSEMVRQIETLLTQHTPEQIKNSDTTKVELNVAANSILESMSDLGWS